MTKQSTKIHPGTSPATLPIASWRPFAVISFLLLFALSFESVPLPIQAQIIPLTSILALLFLPFTITRIRVTPLLKVVVLFAAFVLLHSVTALFVNMAVLGIGEILVTAWARQVIALIAGLSVFLVLRKTLVSVSERFIIYAVIAGALPALAVALLNVLWGLTGSDVAGHIVTQIRTTLIPLGFTYPFRASGLSLEPSFFAIYLAIIVIPVCFVALIISKYRLRWIALLGLILMAFVWTVSVTGFMVLSAFIIAGLLFGPKRRIFAIATVIIFLSVGNYLILFPENYAVWQVRNLLSGEWNISIINRFYSTFGPFINAFSSYTLIGYGLGGSSIYLSEIVPAVAYEYIAAITWEGMPGLQTLVGRIFAETGLVGLGLFAVFIIVTLKTLWHAQWVLPDQMSMSKPFLQTARLVVFSLLVAMTLSYGSFALPYLWFWLAFIDSRYIQSRTGDYNIEKV
jgi:hypothetical protein